MKGYPFAEELARESSVIKLFNHSNFLYCSVNCFGKVKLSWVSYNLVINCITAGHTSIPKQISNAGRNLKLLKLVLTTFPESKWLNRWVRSLSLFWPIYVESLWFVSKKSVKTDRHKSSHWLANTALSWPTKIE